MIYIVTSIRNLRSEHHIIGIKHIHGCTFIEIDNHNDTKLINIRDIGFSITDSYTYNIEGAYKCSVGETKHWKHNISEAEYDAVHVFDNYGYFQMGENYLWYASNLYATVNINDIFFAIHNEDHHELHKYPLHNVVWHDIKTQCMLIMNIHIITDLQRVILSKYLALVNSTLQLSFKLF